MSVEVANETNWRIDPKLFSDLGLWVLDQMRVSTQAEVSITFVDPDPIATLHKKWMQLSGPTDVMSFPMDELRPGTDGDVTPAGILGDIVICPDVAVQQALAAGHSAIEEMLLLTAHGILHLLGFDHTDAPQEHRMFSLQRQLMLTFLAQRPGDLSEISLPPGSPDMLARYYRDHPEMDAGHQRFLHAGASDVRPEEEHGEDAGPDGGSGSDGSQGQERPKDSGPEGRDRGETGSGRPAGKDSDQ